MRVIYVSSLMSEAAFSARFSDPARAPGQAVQKYHRLLSRGLAANGAEVCAVSAPPVTRQNASGLLFAPKGDAEQGVGFTYLPVLLLPAVKHVVTLLAAFFCTLARIRGDCFVLCDALNISVCAGARAAARLRRTLCVGIVTDVPDLMQDAPATRAQRINRRQMQAYDAYVFLTEQMSGLINAANRPFLVAEGHVDAQLRSCAPDFTQKDAPPVLLYAGMLHARYGILRLAEAFSATALDAELHIYGAGDSEAQLREMAGRDPRIRLMGTVGNQAVVAAEARARLLINPRPSDAEFTKYSFPSKNMEYMASGTPVLTTRLPGMPAEYDAHVYLFDGETPAEMARTLECVMGAGAEALAQKGAEARAFVLREKTNKKQAARLLEFAAGLIRKAN